MREEGPTPKERRDLGESEFIDMLHIARTNPFMCASAGKQGKRKSEDSYLITQYMVSALWCLQWHVIARVDDMVNLKVVNLSCAPGVEHAIRMKMKWSKNISRKKDAPNQIILGSMDSRMCPILSMAFYFAVLLNDGPTRRAVVNGCLENGGCFRQMAAQRFDQVMLATS